MNITTKILTAAAAVLTSTTMLLSATSPAFARDAGFTKLVGAVQADAGWSGVEVNRIRRDAQVLHVEGVDRQGRAVTLVRTCTDLRVACPANGSASFAVVAR